MDDTSCIVDRMESISYDLHFQSRAHYVSADYYDDLDRCLTYILYVCQTVAVVSSLVIIVAIGISGEKIRVVAAILLVLSVLASTTLITVKHDDKLNPAEKTRLHNTAGLQLERLGRRADLYVLLGKKTGTTCYDEIECIYNYISTGHSEIEENVIRSANWSFWCAHSRLSPTMKELAEKHKKYIPKEGSCEFINLDFGNITMIESAMNYMDCYYVLILPVLLVVFNRSSNYKARLACWFLEALLKLRKGVEPPPPPLISPKQFEEVPQLRRSTRTRKPPDRYQASSWKQHRLSETTRHS